VSAIWTAGRSGWGRMGPETDVELAGVVRQHVLTAFSQTSLTGDRRDKLLLAQVRNRWPTAVDAFGERAIVAVAGRPPDGCSWCVLDPMPTPTAALRRLLGAQCFDCRVRVDAQPIAQRETEHVNGLVAAGFRPQAAANLRTSEQIADYRRRLDALNRAKLPPRAATGVIRPAARKAPDPPYYRRGRW
jgi:hypothetical protein